MKKQYKGLSLEITALKNQFKIVVEDKTDKAHPFKATFKAEKSSKEEKKQILDEATRWLWNMGDYNGQSDQFTRDNMQAWIEFLGLGIQAEEQGRPNKTCLFEKRYCRYANNFDNCFTCESPSDEEMTCR